MTSGHFPALHGTEIERVPVESLPIGIDHLSRQAEKSAWANNALPTRELLDLEFHRKLSKPVGSRIKTSLQPANYRFDARLDGITMSCGAHIAATKRFVIRSGMQLVVPQAGRTTYSVRGGPSFQVNAGREAFILRPGEYRSTSSQVASLVIQIDKHVVMELTEIAKQIDVTLTSENVRTLPLQHPRYKEPVNRLIKIFQSLSVDDILNTGMRSAVIDFLLDVLMIERNHNRPNSRHPNVNSYEVFRKALSFVQANIDREISNHELCQTLDLTLSALFRLCHEGLGSTPQVWIQTLRLQRALELLKANPKGISLKLVTKKVGFKNLSEFRTFFFHQFGLMPEQVQIALKN